MRRLAANAVFLVLVLAGCVSSVAFPTAFIVAFWLAPFLVGATAGVCRRRWGARAVGIGLLIVLLPPGGVMFFLPTASGAKLASILAVAAAVPFFGALLMATLAEDARQK